ncbi:MAG: hypothetical protein DPW09_32710 [Anaerolineae bacterium]|nr:hypothetical protein [Anaerolineae bacterium]
MGARLPLWNPYLFGGQPALADIQSGALYPPHLLQSLILGWTGLGFPLWALELQAIAHFSLAAVGTYLFIRSYLLASSPHPLLASPRRVRFGGLMASLAFTYGGYLTGFPVQQLTILETSAWLPWVMWAISAAARPPTFDQKQAITHKNISPAPLLPRTLAPYWGALAFAMALLAGHPQTVLYIFYLSLAYTLFITFNEFMSQRTAQTKLTFILHPSSFILMIVLGVCLAAAQLLPTREFIAHSLRADLSYQAVSAGLPLNEFIAILYPGFFGGSPQYVGIVSLVLIALALTIRPPRRALRARQPDPRPPILFWAGAGLVSLLLAFGGNTFLYPLFYLLMPGFEAVRQQERAFLIYSFSAAVLTGYGAFFLTGPLPKLARSAFTRFERRLRWVAALALALTAFFIYGSAAATARGDEVNLFYGVLWHHLFGLIILGGMLLLLLLRSRGWLRRPWGMALLALWLAFNLFTVNWRFNLEKPTNPPPFTPNGIVQFLQTNLPTLRLRSGQALQPFDFAQDKPSNLPTRIVSGGLLPGGNSAASVYNLQDLTGNTPLQLASVENFMRQMPSWRLWQLLSVRYIVDSRNIADAGLRLVFEEGDLKIFEMGDPFPRAWFVGNIEVIAGDNEAISRLASDDFDLRRTAVVPTPLALPPTDPTASTVTILALDPNYLQAQANVSGRQLLVFSQIFYPGWQAKIDSQPAELLRVNIIQQGVVVPEGQHTVELVFSPTSFWLGAAISLTALLVCLGLLVWSNRLIPFKAILG